MTIKEKLDIYYNPQNRKEREFQADRKRLKQNGQPEILAWINPILRPKPVNSNNPTTGGHAA